LAQAHNPVSSYLANTSRAGVVGFWLTYVAQWRWWLRGWVGDWKPALLLAAFPSPWAMSSAPSNDHPAINPVNFGNPGSANHGTNCKPCNKFNPARPDDSCKHGNNCDFCHEPHERPKHRGQRGRHALQRRQYLESKDDHPKEFRDLVDRIYQIPHEAVDKVKGLLNQLPDSEREDKVGLVLERIREIGEAAQSSRPDSNRLRGARIATPEGISTLAEIDGRCKWLVGTLHLMVRKMWDMKQPIDKMQLTLDDILADCSRLPDVLNQSGPSLSASISASSSTPIPDISGLLSCSCSWLQARLHELVKQEFALSTPDERSRTFETLKSLCVQVPDNINQHICDHILKSKSLLHLTSRIEVVNEKHKTILLDDAESLEDLDDPWAKISVADLFDAACISARHALVEKLEDKIEELEHQDKCRFLEKPIRRLTEKSLEALDDDAGLKEVEKTVDSVFEACQILPKRIEFLCSFGGLSAEEAQSKVCGMLVDSCNLNELEAKLMQMR